MAVLKQAYGYLQLLVYYLSTVCQYVLTWQFLDAILSYTRTITSKERTLEVYAGARSTAGGSIECIRLQLKLPLHTRGIQTRKYACERVSES